MADAARLWTNTEWSVLDFETTGTDAARCGVVQAGIAYFNGTSCTRTWCELFNPGHAIPPAAAAVHGIHDPDVVGKPPFGLVPEVGQLLACPVLVTYNGSMFDVPILRRHLQPLGICAIPPHVDVRSFISWHTRARRGAKLEEVCERWGVKLAQAHDAGQDAAAAGRLLLALVDAGLVPPQVDQAVRLSAHYQRLIEAEYSVWSWWLYRDRTAPDTLRLGAGKFQGYALDEADPDYLRWVLALDNPAPLDAQLCLRAQLETWTAPGGGPYRSPGQVRLAAIAAGADPACGGCDALRDELHQQHQQHQVREDLARAGAAELARLQGLLAPYEALHHALLKCWRELPPSLQDQLEALHGLRLQLLDHHQDQPAVRRAPSPGTASPDSPGPAGAEAASQAR